MQPAAPAEARGTALLPYLIAGTVASPQPPPRQLHTIPAVGHANSPAHESSLVCELVMPQFVAVAPTAAGHSLINDRKRSCDARNVARLNPWGALVLMFVNLKSAGRTMP